MHFTIFGLCLVAAFIAAYLWARIRFKTRGWPEHRLSDLSLIALLAGLLGARIRYVWERPAEFAELSGWAWIRAVADIDGGGMVWYGGLILAGGLMIAYAWKRELRVAALADVLASPVLIGLAIGRIGCFFNGCCFGIACELPWAVGGRHPTQLYEAIACALLSLGVAWIGPRLRTPGHAGCLALAGYALWRFMNEGLRDHGPLVVQQVGGMTLTTSQITSLWLLLTAGGLSLWLARRPQPSA